MNQKPESALWYDFDSFIFKQIKKFNFDGYIKLIFFTHNKIGSKKSQKNNT